MNPDRNNEELANELELDVVKSAEARKIIATTRDCVYCGRSFSAVGSANVCNDEQCLDELDSYYIKMLQESEEQAYREGTIVYGQTY